MINTKKATTIDEQIDILKKKGMNIDDDIKAKKSLLDIGYFRIGFYCEPFEELGNKYRKGTTFSNVMDLYEFDINLRNIFGRYLSIIEISFRTQLVYKVSNIYRNSPTWFADKNIMNGSYISKFEEKVYTDTFKQNVALAKHHKLYINDKYAPAWKTLEFMTFGAIIHLYTNIKDEDIKNEIALIYNFKDRDTFENYIKTLKTIRNYCAHNNILYCLKLPRSIKNGPAGKVGQNNSNLFGVIQIMKYMLNEISTEKSDEFEKEIKETYKNVSRELKEIVELKKEKSK